MLQRSRRVLERTALVVSMAGAAVVGLGALTDGAGAAATPTITVTPSTGLTDGATVTITGSGFTPNKAIGVSECVDPFVNGDSCDFATAKIGNSDASGGFTMSYTVEDTIQGNHSCVPTGCLIGASNLGVSGEFANRVSLQFGAAGTTSTSTTVRASTTTTGRPGATTTTARPGATTTTTARSSSTTAAPGASTTSTTSAALAQTGPFQPVREVFVAGLALMGLGIVALGRSRLAAR